MLVKQISLLQECSEPSYVLCLVVQSCLTLCNLMDCSMPRSCVFHCPQIHAHWVSDTNQPSYLLLPFSPFAFNLSQHQGLFQSQLFISGGPSIGVSATVLPIYTQGWFPLGLTGFIFLLSKRLSWVFSNTTVWSIGSSALSLLYGPTLTIVHDYWKNQSSGYMDLCQQSDISAF